MSLDDSALMFVIKMIARNYLAIVMNYPMPVLIATVVIAIMIAKRKGGVWLILFGFLWPIFDNVLLNIYLDRHYKAMDSPLAVFGLIVALMMMILRLTIVTVGVGFAAFFKRRSRLKQN
jgi:hypothetical protein